MTERKNNNYRMYKEIVFNFLNNKCSNCKSDYKLEVHHKDQNPKNNSKNNVELLCYKCHDKKHIIQFDNTLYKIEMNKHNIGKFVYVCECGKLIRSMYPKQFEFHVAQHKLSHEINKEVA